MPPEPETAADDDRRTLIIVTGSGRSGTSTIAGTLKLLGSHVPQPEISPNDANPRGYFEPKWVVEYDKKVLREAGVKTLDGRPGAAALMRSVTARADLLEELSQWFSALVDHSQIVVKDPRIVWLRDMYATAAAGLGMRTAWLTMLRHPAEVVGSRDRHYLATADESKRLTRTTANLAGWVNTALVNERSSRGDRRAFVHYSSLITDWRSTMGQVAERLGLTYDDDLTTGTHHQVDEFIDVSLRRVQVTLDDLDVPATLRVIAENVWSGLDDLSRDPGDADATATLDRMRDDYDRLYVHSAALVQDATDSVVAQTSRRVRRQVTRRLANAPATGPVPSPATRSPLRRAAGRVRRALHERRA